MAEVFDLAGAFDLAGVFDLEGVFAAVLFFAAGAAFFADGFVLLPEAAFFGAAFGFADDFSAADADAAFFVAVVFFGALFLGLEEPLARVVFFGVAMARIILKPLPVVKGNGTMYSSPMAEKDRSDKVKRVISLIAFPLFIAITLALVWIYRHELWNLFKSSEQIELWLEETGILAPIGFIALQFVQVVIFVIPGEVPQIAGGYLFGIWLGTLYSTIGIVLGSAFNFYLARLLGIPFVRNLFGRAKLERFDSIVHSPRAQVAFFLLFVIPGIPKDILCYVAGLSPIRFWVFLTISAIGRLPGIIGSAGMGGAAASSRWILAGSIMGVATVLFVLGLIFREKLHTFVEKFSAAKQKRETDQT